MQRRFTKYLHQKHHFYETYYEHHRLQPRLIKTSDKVRSLSSGHLRGQQKVVKNFQTKKIKEQGMKIRKQWRISSQKYSTPKNVQGRDLFDCQIAAKPNIGPGDYQPILERSHSFGYITKSLQSKALPSQIIKEAVSQSLGPGRYNFQTSQHLLSNHKNLRRVKFNSEKLVRCILPKEETQKIHIKFNDQRETQKEIWKRKLGPGFYNVQNAQAKADKFSKIISLPVSMTGRSSLVKNDKLPGPGYYRQSLGMTEKLHDNKYKKPRIQYQSVH